MGSAFITGTTSGIGLETTLEFARQGWDVFAGVRNRDRAGDLEAALQAEGLSATLVPGDVTDEGQVKTALQQVADATDRLDVVINNAGRVVIAPIEDTDDDEARAVFDANFFGALNVMRSAAPMMRAQGGGTIVNISSIGAQVSPSYYGIYAASKRAMESVSAALQAETEEFGIRVIVIEPGNFRTNIMKAALVARRFGEGSPYLDGLERQREQAKRLYANIKADSSPGPDLVAKAILRAINDPQPRFLYAVGDDAEAVLEAVQKAPPDALALDAVLDRLASP